MAAPLRTGADGDWLSPWIRDLGSYLVHGVPIWRIYAQFMGKEGSTTRGRDGNLHIGGREWNIPCQVSHMADMIPLTVGAALAYQQRGEDRVAVTSFGDAATSRGDFHEGLNIAAVLEVPAIFVAENNGWGYSTPISKQTKVTELYKKAAGYGVPAVAVDGNDVFAVYAAMTAAVDAARKGGGPQFIECRTYRMGGHAAHDKYESYMPMETLAQWSDKDPLKRLEANLTGDRGIAVERLEEIRGRVKDEVADGVAQADGRRVSRSRPGARGRVRAGRVEIVAELTYLEAINAALHDEMELDDRVFCMGEDVGKQGGAFGATKGIQQRFGVPRAIDTPVAEAGHRRRRHRCGHGRAAAGGRDAVRRLRLDRLRPAGDLRRQDALPHRLGGADGDALPQRRRSRRRPVPLRERRGLVPSPRRPQDRLPRHRRGRLRPAAVGHPRSQPGGVLRAQVPVPAGEGRGAPPALTACWCRSARRPCAAPAKTSPSSPTPRRCDRP